MHCTFAVMKTPNGFPDRPLSFSERERQCEELFNSRGPFYHLCTPGDSQLVLFDTNEDFRFAINLMASTLYEETDVNVITFEIMGTHLHVIGEGSLEAAEQWFAKYRRKLSRFYQSVGDVKDLSSFQASIFPINDLAFLRNSIAYVNRNGYLVHPEYTPFSYPWGAGRYFFNPDAKQRYDITFGELTVRQKRNLFYSHSIACCGAANVVDGYISPDSFCEVYMGENFFRDARHYFSLVSRSVEGYKNIAKMLGDSVFYTDDELYLIVRQICRDRYGNARPEIITLDQKMEFARMLHYDYKASDKQIQRMLRIDERKLAVLFGK